MLALLMALLFQMLALLVALAQWFCHFEMSHLLAECDRYLAMRQPPHAHCTSVPSYEYVCCSPPHPWGDAALRRFKVFNHPKALFIIHTKE
jgi:hypothetical protein